MNINLTPVFQALIALLAAIITYRVIPWIKSKTTQSQRADLVAAAKIAVYAAEQIYGTNKEANDLKLEYALARLRDNGFDVDAKALREAVEAAVYDFKGGFLPGFLFDTGETEEEDTADDEPDEVLEEE